MSEQQPWLPGRAEQSKRAQLSLAHALKNLLPDWLMMFKSYYEPIMQ